MPAAKSTLKKIVIWFIKMKKENKEYIGIPCDRQVGISRERCSRCDAMLWRDKELIRYCSNPKCGYTWKWDIDDGEVEL